MQFRVSSVIICKLFCKVFFSRPAGGEQKTILRSEEVRYQMAKCEFCDKGVTFGIQVSHSHRRSNRMWKPNVKRVKVIIDGTPKHAYACTRCLRSGKVTRAV